MLLLYVLFVLGPFGWDRGLVVGCKPELQMVLEKRKREQTQREEGEQSRSPLEQVLLERQHKHQEMMVSSLLKCVCVCVLKTNQTQMLWLNQKENNNCVMCSVFWHCYCMFLDHVTSSFQHSYIVLWFVLLLHRRRRMRSRSYMRRFSSWSLSEWDRTWGKSIQLYRRTFTPESD